MLIINNLSHCWLIWATTTKYQIHECMSSVFSLFYRCWCDDSCCCSFLYLEFCYFGFGRMETCVILHCNAVQNSFLFHMEHIHLYSILHTTKIPFCSTYCNNQDKYWNCWVLLRSVFCVKRFSLQRKNWNFTSFSLLSPKHNYKAQKP